jgi:glycosyltransferase involved in cell wall biosynthesis
MMACWMVLTRNKAKILWSVRGEFNEAALTYSHRRKKVAIFLVRKFLKKSVTFHSTSDHETKCIYQKLGTDVKIVQLPNFMLMPSKEEVMTTKTILYLGRIHPIKAIDQLIIAFSKIDDRNSFRLVIAGSGSAQYTQELKALCRERGVEKDVDFIGHVQGDEKQKCLASAHVLILPSQSENFGNVVVEALAQGTPVIASVNTPWEILDQVMPGSWVPNDPKSLQKAIQKYIEFTPEEYTETRRKAYTLCKERFSIENNIGRWEETYAQILQD